MCLSHISSEMEDTGEKNHGSAGGYLRGRGAGPSTDGLTLELGWKKEQSY